MRERFSIRSFIHIVAPPILYTLIMEICGILMTFSVILRGFFGASGVFSMEGMGIAATAAAAVINIPILWIMMGRDESRYPSDYRYEKTKTWRLLYAGALGFFAAAGMNRLLAMLEIDRLFPGYESTEAALAAVGFWPQIIIVGLLVPVAEELLFRGVVYERVKRFMPVAAAAVFCSLFFGVWHGNVTQGIYAFILGLMMVYVKERYKTLLAPVLFHMCANIFAVLLTKADAFSEVVTISELFPAFLVLEFAVCIVISWRIEEDVHPKKVKKNREWHREEEPVDRI